MNIREQAERQFDYIVDLRRFFHANPELGYQEFAATDRIAKELTAMGIPFTRLAPTGLVGEITGAYPGKVLLIRAEIDALPIQEETDVPFRSQIDGVMHACGHDANTAILLGTARILMAIREKLHGSVRLLFEPAEELGTGSHLAIAQHVLDGVDGVLGLHITSQVPSNAICIDGGAILPRSTSYSIQVTGKSTHGALPQNGANAALAAAAIAVHMQSIVPLEHSVHDRVLVSLCTLHAGSAVNICPESAQLGGTIRAYTPETTEKVVKSLRRIAESSAAVYRCTAQVTSETLCETLVNDEGLYQLSRQSALAVSDQVLPFIRTMASDNFSEYCLYRPSMYVCLGVGGEFPQHSSQYTIDERSLVTGVAFEVDFVSRYLAIDEEEEIHHGR